MKHKLAVISVAAMIACSAALTGCTSAIGISSIEKTASEGLEDTYTIYYTDGSTSNFTVTNGADGETSEINVDDLYEEYKEVYGDITYDEFLEHYLGDASENAAEASVIQSCLLSSVKIYAEFTERISIGFGGFGGTTTALVRSTGAGVIYEIGDEDSYIITNYHVIYDEDAIEPESSEIHCYLYGSEGEPTEQMGVGGSMYYDYGDYALTCELVGGSATYDLALLRVNTADLLAINEDAQAITFADHYSVGETAIAIGNPNGDGISVTKGIVSVDNEYITLSVDGTARQYRSIRIDTPLYNGNSGGGLFNEEGELIGITNAGSDEDENINYAIPLSIVQGVVENIMYYQEYGLGGLRTVTLGVTLSGSGSKYVYDAATESGQIIETVTVSSVSANSIAEKIGLAAGDVIRQVKLNTRTYDLTRTFYLSDMLLQVRPGTSLSFVIERNGEQIETNIYTIAESDLTIIS